MAGLGSGASFWLPGPQESCQSHLTNICPLLETVWDSGSLLRAIPQWESDFPDSHWESGKWLLGKLTQRWECTKSAFNFKGVPLFLNSWWGWGVESVSEPFQVFLVFTLASFVIPHPALVNSLPAPASCLGPRSQPLNCSVGIFHSEVLRDYHPPPFSSLFSLTGLLRYLFLF